MNNPGKASVKRLSLPVRVRDETGVGVRGDDLPVSSGQCMSVCHVDLLCRTAVYVIRMYGGVGGGRP